MEQHNNLQIDEHNVDLKIHWVARTLLLNNQEVKDSQNETFLKRWLKNTQRPEDAIVSYSGKHQVFVELA